MSPGSTPLPQDGEGDDSEHAYFEGTQYRIAPPDWELHETVEQNGDVKTHWTYTNDGDVTTYSTDEKFVARYPSELKLWHICHYQWCQINAVTQEESHICDFYVNLSTQLSHYENPMHHHLSQQLIQINNELKILPPHWRREKSTSGKTDKIMIEPDTVFKAMAMIHEQKWESKFSIEYINELYAGGDSTHIHQFKLSYANVTEEY